MDRGKLAQYGTDFSWQKKLANVTAQAVFFDQQEQAEMKLYLEIHREVIVNISYEFDKQTCLPAHACAHYMCEYLQGKTVMEASLFNHQLIAEAFDGLEKGVLHAAIMVEIILKQALANYLSEKKKEFKAV